MRALHVFDMDGTLLSGTTASIEVARQTGHGQDLFALERSFAAREIDTYGFAQALGRMWQGLTPGVVKTAFTASPWLVGIEAVCREIRSNGGRSVVITMSPDFFANHLLDLGFDQVVASRFPPLPLNGGIELAGILTPSDKVRLADELCGQYKIPRSRCVAYGDSMSDLPLFRHLHATVAVNAHDDLAKIARASYIGNDLTEAFALAQTLLAEIGDS